MSSAGEAPLRRPLHDIDFVAASFADTPHSLESALLLRHVHPCDPPAKTILQGVDPERNVRVDVFRAYGSEMERRWLTEVGPVSLRIVSLHDLLARHARLNWDLIEGKPVAPKYARDFLRLLELLRTDEIESVWQEHRKPQSPVSFAQAAQQLRRVIAARSELLIPPSYSTAVDEICPRCRHTSEFPPADARRILSILGYC